MVAILPVYRLPFVKDEPAVANMPRSVSSMLDSAIRQALLLRVCPTCRKGFKAKRKEQVYCSCNCARKRDRNRSPDLPIIDTSFSVENT